MSIDELEDEVDEINDCLRECDYEAWELIRKTGNKDDLIRRLRWHANGCRYRLGCFHRARAGSLLAAHSQGSSIVSVQSTIQAFQQHNSHTGRKGVISD